MIPYALNAKVQNPAFKELDRLVRSLAAYGDEGGLGVPNCKFVSGRNAGYTMETTGRTKSVRYKAQPRIGEVDGRDSLHVDPPELLCLPDPWLKGLMKFNVASV